MTVERPGVLILERLPASMAVQPSSTHKAIQFFGVRVLVVYKYHRTWVPSARYLQFHLAAIASDKVNSTVFYGGSSGTFYVSKDTGKTFVSTTKLGSSTTVNKVVVNPTVAGDVWVSTDKGLFHSTTYGTSFSQITGPTEGWSFALGKSKSNTYKYNLYGFFTIKGTSTIYQSKDVGATWVRISDTAHGFGTASSNPVAASLDTEGLVYVGTNGRGVFYGTP